jgi:hypothetical protein
MIGMPSQSGFSRSDPLVNQIIALFSTLLNIRIDLPAHN